MKAASPELLALLNGSTLFLMADLYTFTLADSTVLRWTSAETDIVSSGLTFSAQGPLLKRGTTRVIVGLEVDTLDVTIFTGDSVTLGGIPLPLAAANGALDGARVKVERAFMATWGDTSRGTVVLFEGGVSAVDPSSTRVVLKVKSELERLNLALPQALYMPMCSHALYDAGCGVPRAGKTSTGTVQASPAPTTTVLKGNLGQASGYYDLGVLAMTSGVALGARRAVKSYVSDLITLALPLPAAPDAGDTFTIYPGCAKTQTACTTKFANLNRFRGFPYVPRPETAR